MLKHRVIPCLLLKNGGLVKTIRFKDPKYVGDPINAIRIFNEKEVDELIVLDIDASKNNRNPDFTLLEKIAGECFMPLCYGGGIRSLEDAKILFTLGIEKVSLQSALLEDMNLVSNIAYHYGNQSVVASVDFKRGKFGSLRLYSHLSGKMQKEPKITYLQRVVKAGAGEVLVNYVDRDGTMAGMDYDSIEEISEALTVPLIVTGGVGSLEDIKKAIVAGASAVAAGSFFVFHGPHKAVLITYPQYQELEDLLEDVNLDG